MSCHYPNSQKCRHILQRYATVSYTHLNTMVKSVDDNLGNYRIPEAARALQEFVDDMSNWYVRRSRERFWAKGMEQDKINAYMTLYTALVLSLIHI